MSDLTPLPIYAPGIEVDLEPIKAAKAALDLPIKVKPVDAERTRGLRVLAYEKPDWLCDFFLVSEATPPERLQRALAWVLSDVEDEEATTTLDTLNVVFGGGVVEIMPEELASERAWADYFEGR